VCGRIPLAGDTTVQGRIKPSDDGHTAQFSGEELDLGALADGQSTLPCGAP
jgi:hypothetical protein